MQSRIRKVRIIGIIELAKDYSKKDVPWHHHFLTTKCMFNKTEKFQIILENDKTGESFVANFDSKPMKELELLENLFFQQKKMKSPM